MTIRCRMRCLIRFLMLVPAAWLAGCATAPPAPPDPPTCPTAAETAERVQRYLARETLANPPATLTLEGAACGARKFVSALQATQGRVVGYKAGLTNPAVQQRFGVSAPLGGTLLANMLLQDNAEVPARFGARPFAEPDLMVEVASAAIHDARTPPEVLAHLSAVIPFIELPDTLVEDPTRINAPTLVLNNVGARLGVMGARIPVRQDAAFADALRDMTVRTVDGTGKEIASAKGAAVLGHPLNAVIWLAADLKRQGITLKKGDLLSLGAFGMAPVAPGASLRVQYEGLEGNPSVGVRFR